MAFNSTARACSWGISISSALISVATCARSPSRAESRAAASSASARAASSFSRAIANASRVLASVEVDDAADAEGGSATRVLALIAAALIPTMTARHDIRKVSAG